MAGIGGYFNGSIVGIAAGVACAGVPTIATTWRTGRQSHRGPSEPGFSVGLILVYLPCSYAVGGFVAEIVSTSNAIVNSIFSVMMWLTAHVIYLVGRRRQSFGEEIRSLGGLTSVFSAGDESSLRDSLRKDLQGITRARLVAPNVAEMLTGPSPIGDVLRDAVRRGLKLEILADTGTRAAMGTGLFDGHTVVGGDPVDWPPAWLILSLGRVLYFGLYPSNRNALEMPVFRGVCSPGDDVSQLADSVASIAELLFMEARQDVGFGKIVTTSSPRNYRSQIVPAEAGARTVDRLPKRLSVMFKSESTVRSIAEQRFGPGSSSVADYVDEHNARRAEFFSALAAGMRCREIYNEYELVSYVRSRRHSTSVTLTKDAMLETVSRWRNAISLYPSYVVGITRDPLPLKYEVIDGRLVVMHEAIGAADTHRLNAILVHSVNVGSAFGRDFDTIWDRTPPGRRGSANVIKFIDEYLIPLIHE